jgi:N-acetylglucosaminyldiphosphoundecaprenol N-acetyl-beta-D-mannosaminyltransferase
MLRQNNRITKDVLGAHIDAIDWELAFDRINYWANNKESRYVCICNVHSIVTAKRYSELARIINSADMATPDGMPLVWYLRHNGFPAQQRINGPDLMFKYCQLAASRGVPIFLYGGTERTLSTLVRVLNEKFPRLNIAGYNSPPFRNLTEKEEITVIDSINQSGAKVVFVGLGCPKQEQWMAQHKGKIKAVMIGVGAAFDYHAGIIKRAPLWMQRSGLEWLYRLCSEPRRLWRRYLVTNSLFLFYMLGRFLKLKIER